MLKVEDRLGKVVRLELTSKGSAVSMVIRSEFDTDL